MSGLRLIAGSGRKEAGKTNYRDYAMAAIQKRRRTLLGLIHMASKELGLTRDQYEATLSPYNVSSSGKLTIKEMEDLLERFKREWGWRPKKSGRPSPAKILALHSRARDLAGALENGEKRLQGLCQRICGVRTLEWCRDPRKLERLLKVLGEIRDQEEKEGGQ